MAVVQGGGVRHGGVLGEGVRNGVALEAAGEGGVEEVGDSVELGVQVVGGGVFGGFVA